MKKLLIFLFGFLLLTILTLIMLMAVEHHVRTHKIIAQDQYEIRVDAHDFIWGYFTWRSDIPSEPEVRVEYMMPLDFDAKNGDIVFYAPFGNAKNALVRHHLYPLVGEHGMLLFTVAFSYDIQKMLPETIRRTDHTSGWFEEVFKMQLELEKQFGIPHRKLLVIGDSAGATMAQRMSRMFPEHIEAAAWSSASGIIPYGNAEHPPVLALSTWGDSGLDTSMAMAEGDHTLGGYSLFAVSPPSWPEKGYSSFHHGAHDLAYDMMREFLAGVAARRRENEGQSMPPGQWPHKIKMLNGAETSAPSARFKELWEAYPAGRIYELMTEEESGEKSLLTLRMPGVVPDKVILYMQAPSWYSELRLLDNIFFLAENGVLAAGYPYDNENDIATAWNTASQLSELPVYLFVGGEIDEAVLRFIESAPEKELARRLARIVFLNPVSGNVEKLLDIPNALVITNHEEFETMTAPNVIFREEAGESFGHFYFKVLGDMFDSTFSDDIGKDRKN